MHTTLLLMDDSEIFEKPMINWNREQLFKWMSNIDDKDLVDYFQNEYIDGETFVYLMENERSKEYEKFVKLVPKEGLRLKLKLRYQDYVKSNKKVSALEDNECSLGSIIPMGPKVNDVYTDMAKTFSYANMILRDGLSSTISHAPSDVIAGLQRGLTISLSPVIYNIGVANLYVHDAIAPGVLLSIQMGLNIYRWYQGDITGKQFIKNMTTNVAGVLGGVGGTTAGVAAAVAIGAAVGAPAGPVGIVCGGLLGAILGGLIASGITRVIAESICPDGDLENFITKRNEMILALNNLHLTEKSTEKEIKQAWKNGCRLYHPDKNKEDWDKVAQNRWLMHQLSYEVVKSYNEVIQNAKKGLNFTPDETHSNSEILKELENFKPNKNEIRSKIQDQMIETETEVEVENEKEDEEVVEDDKKEEARYIGLWANKNTSKGWTKDKEDLFEEKCSKAMVKKVYYYDCLVIHYKNRYKRKNCIRKFFDTISNPFSVIEKSPLSIAR